MSIKVTIVDDHPIFRKGLVEVIRSDPSFTLVNESSSGSEALASIKRNPPDVAVLDIELPEINGLDLTRKLLQLPKPVPVLLLTMHKEETLFNEAMDRGAKGFVLKENAVTELISGIKAVARGEVFLSPSVSGYLLKRHQRRESFQGQHPGLAALTPMERRVLKLTGENLTCREIGKELFISHRTVQTHRNNIAQKLNLRGSHKLLQFAIQHRSEL